MPEEEMQDRIVEAAKGPKSYENDGEKITQHSLSELIDADKYLRRKKAAGNPFGALKIAKISTQGPEA